MEKETGGTFGTVVKTMGHVIKAKEHVQRTAIVRTDFVVAQETARKIFPQHHLTGSFG